MKSTKLLASITAAFFVLMLLSTAAFAVPQTINYQGYIEDSDGTPINGHVTMTILIYNVPSGGSAFWGEIYEALHVTDGVFNVALGSMSPLTTLAFDQPYYLGIEVNGDGEMSPRVELTSVPYAMRADDADTLNGQHSSEIIDAASDEVRTPISSIPFTIDTPGSYYLTDDLYITSGVAITVNSNYVTIDLMGFSLNGAGAAQYGIHMSGRQNVEVRNGTIRGFSVGGIYEPLSQGKSHRVINVRVVGGGGTGIYLYGFDGGHLIKDSTVSGNGDMGIYVYNGSTVSGVVAANNGSDGIFAYDGCLVKDNIAYQNGGNGIWANKGSTVKDNTVHKNQQYGIRAEAGSTVSGNTAYNNGSSGIWAGNSTTVKDNTAYFNQWEGIFLSSNSLVDGNTAYGNNQSGESYSNMNFCGNCTVTPNNHTP